MKMAWLGRWSQESATSLQVSVPPLANTARYDSLRLESVAGGTEEVDHGA